MTKKKKTWGTSRGIPLTDELIERMADEAERGYDVEELRRRKRKSLMRKRKRRNEEEE